MFCKKCGTQIADGGTFCPKCGTPVSGSSGPTPSGGSVGGTPGGYTGGGSSGDNSLLNRFSQKQLLIAAGAVVVAVVLVIVLLANLLGGCPKGALKDYYKAIEKQDAGKMVACVPKDLLKDIEESYNCDKDDIIDAVDERMDDDYLDDYAYSGYDAGDKVDYKVTDKDAMKERRVKSNRKDLKSTLKGYYEIDLDKFDTSKIKKGSVLDVEYDDGDEEYDANILKYKGDWYYDAAIYFVVSAAYYELG